MAILSALAQIGPDQHTREFWEACRRRELRLQRCAACGRFRHPPIPGCPHCGSPRSDWPRLTGRGTVFSYTVVHHPAVPALKDAVPYNVVVVELDGTDGARLISNLLDTPPAAIAVGMAVELVWDEVRPDVVLPRFRPLREAG